MEENRVLFDLANRVPWRDPFDSVEKTREYDLDIRTSMIIPRQHVGYLVEPLIAPGSRVLEVTGGTGLLSLRLAARHPAAQFTVVESNPSLLAVLQDNVIFANLLEAAGNLCYETGRPENLPAEDGSFDVVVCFSSFSRWLNPVGGLKECRRVCRPDGLVLIYDMARDADQALVSFVLQYAGDYGHEFMSYLRSSFTVPEMQGMLAEAGLAGWHVETEGISMIVSSRPLEVRYQFGIDPEKV